MSNTSNAFMGRQNGFKCPQCHRFIPLSVQTLFHQMYVDCPTCGLHLSIDRKESAKAMNVLKKVVEGQREIDMLNQ